MSGLALWVVACAKTAPVAPVAQTPSAMPPVAVVPVAPSVWRHVSHLLLPKVGPFPSNGLVVAVDGGSVLIDTACSVDQTVVVLDWAEANVGPVQAVVATHFHSDRIGGIEEVRRRGIPTVGLAATSERMAADGNGTLDRTFEGELALDGVDGALFFPGAGHTSDNLVVGLAGPQVLFGGCLIKDGHAKGLGNVADGDLATWDTSAEAALARFHDTQIVVPGHGDPGGPEIVAHTAALVAAARAAATEAR